MEDAILEQTVLHLIVCPLKWFTGIFNTIGEIANKCIMVQKLKNIFDINLTLIYSAVQLIFKVLSTLL